MSKIISYISTISLTDFAYLVVCHPYILIHKGRQHNAAVYHPALFCRHFGYNKKLPRIAD